MTISEGKVGLFNHAGNNTLIRSINMQNVIESSKTKKLLEDIFSLDWPNVGRQCWRHV